MKKTILGAIFISAFLVSLVAGIQTLEAQSYQAITIKPDGSIEPETHMLERNGTTYTFKGDIFGSIMVQTGYLTIDGAGYTLQGQGGDGITLAGPDLSHRHCRNVLVKNLRFYNCGEGIYSVGASNNSFIGNYFDKSSIHLMGSANLTGDLLKHNTFIDSIIFVDYNRYGLDVITENNFFSYSGVYVGLSDMPVVDKNYWSNYTTKYPDAKELGNSGIWNTPHVYDNPASSSKVTDYVTDYHPLVVPITYGITDSSIPVPEFTISLISGASVSGYSSTEVVVNGIQINIANQPYAYSFNGTAYVLCYDYRYKAHSAQSWEESPYSQNNSYPPQSNSNTTILTIPEISLPQQSGDLQIDFRVQAIAGHYYQTESGTFIFPKKTSSWSQTHTITFPRPHPSHTQSPTPTPTLSPTPTPTDNVQENFTTTIIIFGLVVTIAVVVGLLVYFKKRRVQM